jgi:putative solute:sodium symporter small subunit
MIRWIGALPPISRDDPNARPCGLWAAARGGFRIYMKGGRRVAKDLKEYWRRNIKLMVVLLSIWFFVSYLLGIILVVPLNAIKIGGFPLGFWFAQQGSIYVFVVLIFVYCALMRKLDREYDVEE